MVKRKGEWNFPVFESDLFKENSFGLLEKRKLTYTYRTKSSDLEEYTDIMYFENNGFFNFSPGDFIPYKLENRR